MRVDVEHVLKLQAERKKINDLDFDEIEWYKDGKKVEIDPEVKEEFKFTGLTNICFTEMYEEDGFADLKEHITKVNEELHNNGN